jgi:DNA-binding transcriptional MerR regulator
MKPVARNRKAGDQGSQAETLTTGEMARLSNNTLRTVRFYEEAGILAPIGRTEGGHRVFERHQLERLTLVTDMREAGLSLDEIRKLLETKEHARSGGAAAETAIQVLRKHIADLKAKMEVLGRLSQDLEQTIRAAEACLGCKDSQFPEHCRECGKMGEIDGQPRGMRVLWALNEKGQREPAVNGAANGSLTNGATANGVARK